MSFVRRAAAMLACLLATPALAWGPLGHSVVAELAQRHLSPAAEAEVERLLAPEHTRSLADVANWADQMQDDPAMANLWKQTRNEVPGRILRLQRRLHRRKEQWMRGDGRGWFRRRGWLAGNGIR